MHSLCVVSVCVCVCVCKCLSELVCVWCVYILKHGKTDGQVAMTLDYPMTYEFVQH